MFCYFCTGNQLKNYDKVFNFISVNPMLKYFSNNVYNRECGNNWKLLYHPWDLLYFHYGGVKYEQQLGYGYERGFSNCYKYVNILYNVWFCFILLLIFVYLSTKIKKNIFDFTFILSIVFSGLISYIFVHFHYLNDYTEKLKKFSFDFLLGENYSYKYTHLFMLLFLWGNCWDYLLLLYRCPFE